MGRKRGGNRGGKSKVVDQHASPTNSPQGGHPGRNGNYMNHHGFSTGAFGVMGSESDDFIQRSESDGQPTENQQSDREDQRSIRDSRTTSQLSIRSIGGFGNQSQSDGTDLKQAFGGSRSSSRSRMISESNTQRGEKDWSDREALHNNWAASQMSMRSSNDFDNVNKYNTPDEQQSLRGSRASSRSRMYSETDLPSNVDYRSDRDADRVLGERAMSQFSMCSHRGLKNGSEVHILSEKQSFGGSRESSRPRMLSGTDVQPNEDCKSERDAERALGDRALSQFSMRSHRGLENGSEIYIPNEKQSFGGSRASSRSRLLSETDIQHGEGYQSDRDPHQALGKRAMSQFSMRSHRGWENGSGIHIPNEQQSFGRSRASSRSRMLSETDVQPNEDSKSDRDDDRVLGDRAMSQFSMRSHRCLESMSEIHIPIEQQSFVGSRASSRSRMLSETDVQPNEDCKSDRDADRALGDRSMSQFSMRSHRDLEKDGEIYIPNETQSFGRSRSSSRSRKPTYNESHHLSGSNDQQYLRSARAASQLSMVRKRSRFDDYFVERSNVSVENGIQHSIPSEKLIFRDSRASSRSRMLSEADEHPSGNRQTDIDFHQYSGDSHAMSQLSIRSNRDLKNESHLFIPNDTHSFGGSRASSRSRMLSEGDDQSHEDRQSDNIYHGSRSVSHISINSSGVENKNNFYAPDDRQSFQGSRAHSQARMVSEADYQSEYHRSNADVNSYCDDNMLTSNMSISSKGGFDSRGHLGVLNCQESLPGSLASSRSRLLSDRAGIPDEGNQSGEDLHRHFGDARAMSQISIRSTGGFNDGNQFSSRENAHSFVGNRSSSRSRLHSNRGCRDDNYDAVTHGFNESRASSHISVRSISDDDEIMYAVLPKTAGEFGALNRKRFISMTSNASGGGYETDENLRLARINSGKEAHLNLDSNVLGSRLSMMAQSDNAATSRVSMFSSDGTQHSITSKASTYEPEHGNPQHVRTISVSSMKPSAEENEVPVPLCSTNAMTPCSIRNRLISDHGDSPAICEKTSIEAVPANYKVSAEIAVQTGDTIRFRQDERQRNVFNNSFEKRGHPAAAVLSGMLQQRGSDSGTPPSVKVQNGQDRLFHHGASFYQKSKEAERTSDSTAPGTPKSSRNSGKNVSMGRVSLNESHHGGISSYCQSDASMTDRFSDVSYGSAYRWKVRESKMEKSRSGLADAKWEQKKRDPGRTVRNNVKPGMILKLASVFDQKQVQSNGEVSLRGSIERKPRTDDSKFRQSAPMNEFNDHRNSINSNYHDERNRNNNGKMSYNGIQDAYFDVSQDTDDSDFDAVVNSTPLMDNDKNKCRMEHDYDSLGDASDVHRPRSVHLSNVKNMAAQFDKSNSMESVDHAKKTSTVVCNFEKCLPDPERYGQNTSGELDADRRAVRKSSTQKSEIETGPNNGASHSYRKTAAVSEQIEKDNEVFRRSSAISRQTHSDIMEDHFNGHIDNLFGFVQDHDSRSNATEGVHRSFQREDLTTDRRGLARSVSKYREMQRSKRVNTVDGPIKFTPASVPNAGQLAQNRSDYKKTLTIDNRIVALATSTPRESPHGTTKDFNANYDDSFLSSITDGSRGPEKYSDYRHQMNKLNHALDMTATQIAMTEKVLLQARKERKPLQELAAQRTLLVSNQKVKLLHKEVKKIQELSNVRRLPPPLSKDVRGSMMISDIIVHLNPRFYNERNADNNCSFAFVVLLKCGYEVEATSPVTIQSQSQFRLRQLHFFEKISFGNLPMSFEIQLEVYYMVVPGNKYDASCAANLANKCRNIFNPARKVDRNVDGLSVGEFSRCGYLLLTRDTSSKTTFYLDSAEYPLESTIEVRSRCSELPPAIEVDFRGFLTMCQYVSGIGSWERYWAVLRRGCIYFWRYPDDESIQRDPRARLDLTNCIRETILPCGPEQCPRAWSFSIDVLVSTTPSVMDRKRILLSADSAELMHSWLNAINETLNVIHC